MNTPTQQHAPLTRADIVKLLGEKVTVRQIRRNEKRWGLFMARVPQRTNPVLYYRSKALLVLHNLGFENLAG